MNHEQAARLPGKHPSGPEARTAPPAALVALLARADIRINGHRPWDIQVHNPRLYRRMFSRWSLGVGESYMDGDWDCQRLDELFTRLLRADLEKQPLGWSRVLLMLERLL